MARGKGEQDNVEPLYDAKAVGNAAAMREVLEALSAWANIVKDNPKDKTAMECVGFVETVVSSAVAAPPRNCDVGTSEDQGVRFKNFCRNHQFISVDSEDGFPPMYVCSNESCPLHGYYIAHGEDNCELAWAQMPYESQNGKG